MKAYNISIEGRKLHYLSGGKGPVIMLFHASPMSSRSLMPLIQLLQSDFTVIAPDTPGYGLSDLPVAQPEHIIEYVEIFDSFRNALGIEKMAVYGTATGAQIAIRYGLAYPHRISHIFLDNTAHFSGKEKEEIFESYFPDYTPKSDGSHLMAIWDTVIHLFQYFPWCFQTPKYKLSSPIPPVGVLHHFAMEYLRAGPEYDWAYKAAFRHEDRKYIQELKVPTHIFRWEASIIKAYAERIFEIDLPKNITSEVIPKSVDRYSAMHQAIYSRYKGDIQSVQHGIEESAQKEMTNLDMAFPEPEVSGQYLQQAWSTMRANKKEQTVDDVNQAFIYWASSQTK